MYKHKYFVFLLFGLALGIGLFVFIGRAVSTDSNNLMQTEEIIKDKQNKQIEIVDDKPTLPLSHNESSSIQVRVPEETDDSQATAKDSQTSLFDFRMQKMNDDTEKKALGKQILKELITKQPHELNVLFVESNDPYDGRDYKHIDGRLYGLHLTEDLDEFWASNSEAYLSALFFNLSDINIVLYRINCRSHSCEVAGALSSDNIAGDYAVGISEFYKYLLVDLNNNPEFLSYFQKINNRFLVTLTETQSYPVVFTMIVNRARESNL